jgi:uncharacterized protein (TIRG00374 family)
VTPELTTETKNRPSLMKRLFWLMRLFGIVLFVVILLKVDLKDVAKQLSFTDGWLLAAGLSFQFIVLVAKGIRWHLMNAGKNEWKYWKQSLGRFYESYAIGVVTPARMGELLKAGHEKGSGNVFTSVIRVIAERGLDIGVFVILAGLSVLTGAYLKWPDLYSGLIIFSGLAFLIISMFLLASSKFNVLVNNLVHLLPGKMKSLHFAHKSFSGSTSAFIITLSLLSNISYFISCYFLALSTGLEAGFIWTSGAVAVSGLLNMLPVTIMGVGTRELTFLYVFNSYPQSIVLSFSFLVVLIAQIGGGLISLAAGQFFLHSNTRKKS